MAAEGVNCSRVAVVGIGNILLKDEGVGVHVARTLRQSIGHDRPDINIIDGGTSPDTFLTVEGVNTLIIVDAVKGGSPPGSIYRFHPDDIFSNDECITSLHQIGVLCGLKMMELSGTRPDDTVIIGIEPKEIDWGMELTTELNEKIPQIIKVIETHKTMHT